MCNPTSFTSSKSRCPCGAEKFEAMVKLRVASTRMKDFCDLQVLSSRLAFDGKTFSKAVRKTFLDRGTELPKNRMPIFLVPVVAAVHERTLFSLQWRPGGAWRGIGPADLRD